MSCLFLTGCFVSLHMYFSLLNTYKSAEMRLLIDIGICFKILGCWFETLDCLCMYMIVIGHAIRFVSSNSKLGCDTYRKFFACKF